LKGNIEEKRDPSVFFVIQEEKAQNALKTTVFKAFLFWKTPQYNCLAWALGDTEAETMTKLCHSKENYMPIC
jgi:hypothetical protein